MTSLYIPHLLSLGVKETHKIATSQSYVYKEKTLRIRELPPETRHNFLSSPLEDMNAIDDEELEENERKSIDQRLPFWDDSYARPEEIMKLSQQHAPLAIYEEMNWPYQQRGYSPWKPAEDSQENPVFVSMSDMQKSWNAIVEIYQKGGQG
ncbi:hypothetical protein BGZ60DRAFT_432413 [Tricladium varicosporioides]|nr:hypothetical protein BGZ60DRAFT_432413 [Hymenoscyphus varicosporioides]